MTPSRALNQLMRSRFARLFGAAALGLSLSGEAQAALPDTNVPGTFSAGRNMLGTACVAVSIPLTGSNLAREADSAVRIDCEGDKATNPIAARVIRIAPAGSAEGIDEAYLKDSLWRQELDGKAVCTERRDIALSGGITAKTLRCALRDGGFPYYALTVTAGNQVYLAEGVPTTMSAAAIAILLLSGDLTFIDADKIALIRQRFDKVYKDWTGGVALRAEDIGAYRAYMVRARRANREGDYLSAEQNYREALALNEKIFGADQGALISGAEARADVVMGLALEMSNQERFSDADELFARAQRLQAKGVQKAAVAKLISYRANHEANRRNRTEALSLAAEATRMRAEIAAPYLKRIEEAIGRPIGKVASEVADLIEERDAYGQAQERIVLADISTAEMLTGALNARLGETQAALAAFERAELALLLSRTDASREPTTALFRLQLYSAWANTLVDAGKPGEAIAKLDEAEAIPTDIVIGTRTDAVATFARARALAALGRPAETVLNQYQEGFDVIAEIAARGRPIKVEIGRVEDYFRVLTDYQAAAPRAAAPFVESGVRNAQLLGRSVTSEGLLISAHILKRQSEDTAIRDAVRDYDAAEFEIEQTQLGFDLARAAEVQDPVELDAWARRAAAAVGQRTAARAKLEAVFPDYFALSRDFVPLSAIQASARPGEAIVQFILGARQSYGLLLSADGAQFYPIAMSQSAVGDAVRRLREPLLQQGRAPFDAAASHGLYAALLGPISGHLSQNPRLVVVPQGPLLSLPMAVLVTAAPADAADYGRMAWLSNSHSIRVAPSLASLVTLRSAPVSKASRPLIGFGEFVPPKGRLAASAAPSRGTTKTCRQMNAAALDFVPLPETRQEIEVVATTLHAEANDLFFGSKFAKKPFEALEPRLNDYRVVYFATHGFLPEELDCWSPPGLLMSADGAATTDDILLSAPEIMDLNLDADLVVLSACNTGGYAYDYNRQRAGESLSGLVRAFLQVGARSVLASHWAVPSVATKDLMIKAFEAHAAGADYADAIANAQRSFVAAGGKTSHPYYWAAFSLIGDSDVKAPAI